MPSGSRPEVGSSRISTSRRAEEREREAHPLREALREPAAGVAPPVGDAGLRERGVDRLARGRPFEPGEPRVKREERAHLGARRQGEALGR